MVHLVMGALVSAVKLSVPFPSDRPLQIRILDRSVSAPVRPAPDRGGAVESGPVDRPSVPTAASPRALDPSGIAAVDPGLLRPSTPPPAPTPPTDLYGAAPRTVPAEVIPPRSGPLPRPAPRAARPVPSAPAVGPHVSARGPAAPRALEPDSAPGSPRALVAPRGASVPPPAQVGGATVAGERAGRESQPSSARAGQARAGLTVGSDVPGVAGSGSGGGSARHQAGDAGGQGRGHDLRGQVAMLWKNLDPRQYTWTGADDEEVADPGGSTGRTISLDSQDVRYASYLLGIKRRIEALWGYPSEARGLSGNLVVTFRVARDGQLQDLQLVETSGIAPLDNEAIRAIREAAPFTPFPDRMRFDHLNIRAAFYYYASRAQVGRP
jgi:TonB family protein